MTRRECRQVVFKRACGCCERCGLPVRDDVPEWHPRRAHCNERTPRSLGGDWTDPENVELTCQQCHTGSGHAPTAERAERLRNRRREEWP